MVADDDDDEAEDFVESIFGLQSTIGTSFSRRLRLTNSLTCKRFFVVTKLIIISSSVVEPTGRSILFFADSHLILYWFLTLSCVPSLVEFCGRVSMT